MALKYVQYQLGMCLAIITLALHVPHTWPALIGPPLSPGNQSLAIKAPRALNQSIWEPRWGCRDTHLCSCSNWPMQLFKPQCMHIQQPPPRAPSSAWAASRCSSILEQEHSSCTSNLASMAFPRSIDQNVLIAATFPHCCCTTHTRMCCQANSPVTGGADTITNFTCNIQHSRNSQTCCYGSWHSSPIFNFNCKPCSHNSKPNPLTGIYHCAYLCKHTCSRICNNNLTLNLTHKTNCFTCNPPNTYYNHQLSTSDFQTCWNWQLLAAVLPNTYQNAVAFNLNLSLTHINHQYLYVSYKTCYYNSFLTNLTNHTVRLSTPCTFYQQHQTGCRHRCTIRCPPSCRHHLLTQSNPCPS